MKLVKSLWALIISISFIACGNDYSPKPRAYHRIKFPERNYQKYQEDCPFTFKYPTYSVIVPDKSDKTKPCWINISYPEFNGKIHLSYQAITSKKEFNQLVEDAHTFAHKHVPKATAIDAGRIAYPNKNVYGIYYTISGNTASSIQFFLTDSTKHYLRAALYFNEEPRQDSIKPVLEFVKQDIDTLIKSFNWK